MTGQETPLEADTDPHSRGRSIGTAASLRGSSGMLVGYGFSQVVNLVVQVGIVRYLSKDDYGAVAWALSAVILLEALVPLGLDRASARFLSKYDEEDDHGRLFGLILLEGLVLVGVGTCAVVGGFLLRSSITDLAPSPLAVDLLLILLALAPIQALDAIVVDMFAVFSRPWTVFLRRYLLQPLARLLVVVLMIVSDGGAVFLAVGFVVVGAVTLVLFLVLLRRLFRELDLLGHFSWRTLRVPVREVAVFCGPVLLGSFVASATLDFPAIVLGAEAGETEVAVFRAGMPFAMLNLGVLFTFSTLFTPSAARLFARGALSAVRDLYWSNAIWVALLTFPVLAMTSAFARQFTVVTLGERYESSAAVLTVLSLACYLNAVFGFNGLTVQILGRTRWILLANVVTLVFMVPVTYLLVGSFGAVGAAGAVLATVALHNLAKQSGLGFGGGIGMVQRGHGVVLLTIAALLAVLVAVSHLSDPPLWACLGFSMLAWLMLIAVVRRHLRLDEVFPEAANHLATRWLVAGSPSGWGSGRG